MTTTLPTDATMHSLEGLHGWLPLAEVADHLNVKRDTIYHVVMRADELEQDWAKMEGYPYPGGPRRWLINTDAEIFQHHQRRWKHLAEGSQRHENSHAPIPPLPDFPWAMPEDENPLGREAYEDAAYPFAMPFDVQAPFAFPPALPMVPGVKEQHVQRTREGIELSLLILLQLIAIICIVKRTPGQEQ